ncbi:sensor histidine kinase [Spirosoma pollinicola]|uniref:Histidine kinase n=1 Tax=Spirosoma pollinicola TaxID=2057025 RepID=A0A2K8ZCH8_9BACT|nr:histidine kinase [Spirosoma pollinicola]AUD07566.1 histidine kinase [Spirosoma pollinicola]
MKTIIVLLIGWLYTAVSAQAQINWDDYSQSYTEGATGKSPSVGLVLALRKGNDFLWSIRKTSDHFFALEKDSAFHQLRPKELLARTTFDTARAQFFLHGVGPKNANLFQFRVIEYPGNRVLVPWRGISQFTDSTLIRDSDNPQMAYLGGYRTRFGSMLILDVRKVATDQIVATSLVAWESIKPVITNIYTSETIDQFLKKLQFPWAAIKETTDQQSPVLVVPSTNTNIVFVLRGTIFYKEQIQYELIRNSSIYTPWRFNDYDNSFVWLKDFPPGNYVLKIRFSAQPQNIDEYRFDVLPAWYQTNLFRISVGVFVAALLGACLFLLLFIGQRRKTQQEQFDKTRSQLELKAIYAQLNPHFVFNALSSIQGLINKQDIKGANSYLSDFARLLRESLKHSHKDELSLHEEIQTLDTYLKLEQLRFGFQYTINVDTTINVYETSLPVLLLQPLVENAVKHGVASLQEKGVINVTISRVDHTMLVSITDNGQGYMEDKLTPGMGLKLTRDRIQLLNRLHPDQPITYAISNALPSGMQLTFTFKQWFL